MRGRPAGERAVLALVFAGGCLGGGLRFGAGLAFPVRPLEFPTTLLAVNLVGTFLLALLLVLLAESHWRPAWAKPLLGTGFCGGLTTFSFVVSDSVLLYDAGRASTAAAYLGATILGGLGAAVAGCWTGRTVLGRIPG